MNHIKKYRRMPCLLLRGGLILLTTLQSFVNAQGTNLPPGVSTNQPLERFEIVQIDLANGFLAKDFYDLAIIEYQKYLEWFPHGTFTEEATYRIADCLRGLGQWAAARDQYQKNKKTFPKGSFFARASFRLGEIEWNAGRYPEALHQFHQAAEKAESAETRLTAYFYEARTLIQLKRSKEAIPMLHELARVEKENPYRGFAFLELARVVEASGREDEACVFYSKVLEVNSSPLLCAEAGASLGMLQMKTQKWTAAITTFEKVRKLEIAPEWIHIANLQLVRAYYQSNQHEAVLKILTDSKNHFPDNSDAEVTLLHAHALRLLKKYKEAVKQYDHFLKKNPQHASAESAAYERLICLYAVKASSWDAEATAFTKIYPQAQGLPRILYLQAERAFQRQDYALATTSYAAIPLEKIDSAWIPDILYHHGLCLIQTARYEQAVQTFNDFLKRFPNHTYTANILFQRGSVEERIGNLELALVSFQELAKCFPKATEREAAIYRTALLFGELKKYSMMHQTFEQLTKDFPDSKFIDDAAYWIGWSFFEEKKYAEAIPYLQKARQANTKEYGSEAASRIILAYYHLKQRAELLKETDALPANASPLAPEIYGWLAQTSAQEKDFAVAERYFRKLLSHADAAGWKQTAKWGLAKSLSAQAKWKEAIEIFENYQKDYSAPAEMVAAKLELVKAYVGLKEFKQAQEIAEEIMRLQPEGKNNAEARYLLGEMMFDQEKFSEAGKYFLSIAVLYDDPEMTPQSLARAIKAFESAGQTNEVSRLTQELKTKYPNYR